ncbi:hypothetical protein [Roseicyclus mahoneyensis]|uniref:Uncharacterized protein n=1 Tax=Roseicyclus mahoneyensis TaxID=164332 RepID=A0A316GJ88_9RHOB|nr:hypothetical protein [Roseicyclus mahoneyensis]PWK60665.1 hypothetical protein C7455_104303 [Roseicyclus mahoneyensis]
MQTEKTLIQLLSHPAPRSAPARAVELGQLGYMQWLGALPPAVPYGREAARALALAQPFEVASPAVAEFCRLLRASLMTPLSPLDLALPRPKRRGGTRMRRLSL